MNKMEPTIPQWICTHCFIHLVNGDCTEPDTCHVGSFQWECDGTNENDPLHLFGDVRVTVGMLSEEHNCCRGFGDDTADECDCETNAHSTSACDGCGSQLHGERHAVTGWIKN